MTTHILNTYHKVSDQQFQEGELEYQQMQQYIQQQV